MTGGRQTPSAYDRMLAEIGMDDDDGYSIDGNSHLRTTAAAMFAPGRAEAKATVKEPVATAKFTSRAQEEKIGEEAASRSSSFPPAPRKSSSRRGSRSQHDVKDTSEEDESDEEKETRVRHHDTNGFDGHCQKPTLSTVAERGLDVNALRAFVTHAPRHGTPTIRCYVQRDRHGIHRLNPVYRLFMEDGKQFLLCAQKRTSSKTSNYLLTLSQTPTDRRSALNVAKLRANWSGSEYIIFDHGLSPSKTALDASIRDILGVVEFAYDEMGPGRMNVRIPTVRDSGVSAHWKDTGIDNDDATRKAILSKFDSSALLLRNKRPLYDVKSGGHVLDFQGRVTMPSVKNFQMQCDIHGDDTILQFGRVSCQPPGPFQQCKCHKDTFTLDLKHPLSPVQAFAVCLATLDSKVADGKAFETVSSLLKKLSS